MNDKIKKRIEIDKKDKQVFKDYIDAFVKSDKAKEIYKDNNDIKSLTGSKDEIQEIKEEDEFF